MRNYILEACVDSVESALAAQRGGATRLELCGNLVIGGTTPSVSLFREIRRLTDLRIHVLIRPRFGDFCYTDYEFAIMCDEVKTFKALGAEGVVIGILHPDGTLNLRQMRKLMKCADGMSVTLHRAFDVCVDPMAALEQAVALSIDTILTSGQEDTCMQGKALLAELVRAAGTRISIQIGSGVDADVIRALVPVTGARAYHMSGKITADSRMTYRKTGVSMGLPSLSEYTIFRTEEQRIHEACAVLEAMPND